MDRGKRKKETSKKIRGKGKKEQSKKGQGRSQFESVSDFKNYMLY